MNHGLAISMVNQLTEENAQLRKENARLQEKVKTLMGVDASVSVFLGYAFQVSDFFEEKGFGVTSCNHVHAIGFRHCPECGHVVKTAKAFQPLPRAIALLDLGTANRGTATLRHWSETADTPLWKGNVGILLDREELLPEDAAVVAKRVCRLDVGLRSDMETGRYAASELLGIAAEVRRAVRDCWGQADFSQEKQVQDWELFVVPCVG